MKHEPNKLHGKRRSVTQQTLRLCLLPLFMGLGWAGCQPQAKVTPGTDPAGTYTLVSVDKNQVPCALQHEGQTLTVKSGSFVITPDGTCSSTVVFSPPSGSEVTREVKATYTREGPKLTMKWERAGTTIGTVEGDMFTMNNEGMIFAYAKQK